MKRMPISQTLRQHMHQLSAAGMRNADIDPLNDLTRLAARLLLQDALEAKQADYLGRERCRREVSEAQRGLRKGEL